jgi:hypothetical protein
MHGKRRRQRQETLFSLELTHIPSFAGLYRMDDGTIRMYYTGQGKDGSTAIGVAKLSTTSNEWVREQASFSFA